MEAGALQAPAGLSRISISSPLLRLRTDEQLVAAFRSGNEEAFQVIFDRYRQRLFAYTRQMLAGSRQDAEDALQDVFLRAYAALRANDRPVSLRAWLYRVAHNRCIDQLRRPTPASPDIFDVSRTPLRDPVEESARREDLRRLVADVRRLPEAQRSALLMREMDGLSYQELADALDVTVPAIKSLLVRARIGLVEAIEARDTACTDIRNDLLASYDRGVRATGKARRHLRDCAGCRAYRTDLRSVQRGLGALNPGAAGPFALVAKLFGIGGSAGGAAAGTGAVIGGGGAAVVGGGTATVTACKVAALVCSAALVTGAATNVQHAFKSAVRGQPTVAAAPAPAPAPAPGSRLTDHAGSSLAATRLARLPAPKAAATPAQRAAARRDALAAAGPSAAVAAGLDDADAPLTPDDEVYATVPEPAPTTAVNVAGGAKAPDEPPADVVVADPAAPAPAPATTGVGATPPTTGAPATGTPAPATGAAPAAGPTPSANAPAPAGSTAPAVAVAEPASR